MSTHESDSNEASFCGHVNLPGTLDTYYIFFNQFRLKDEPR